MVDSIHIDPVHFDKYVHIGTLFLAYLIPLSSRLRSLIVTPVWKVCFLCSFLSFEPWLNIISGLFIGQVWCIFSLPPCALDLQFLAEIFMHKHLAYVKWFTLFTHAQKDRNSNLFKVSHLTAQGEHCVSIIPVSLTLSSIQLFPNFGPQAPISWSLSNVLEMQHLFTVAQKTAPMFAYYIKTHVLLNADII